MISNRKKVNTMILLMTFTYMVSYITRINFGAVISEIITAENLTKSALSTAVTGSFITYGAGQIVSGFFGDRIKPKRLILCGFTLTVLMNLLIPFCPSPALMTLVWCINGFAQSFMWPPLVKLMTELFSNEDYQRACVTVSWGSSFGTILVYLVAPLLISFVGWKGVFFFSAFSGIIMMIFWQIFCPDTPVVRSVKVEEKNTGEKFSFLSPLMLCIMVSIVIQGALRDGITTWTPSYISETYNLPNTVSILSGVLLPIFSVISFKLTSIIHNKVFKNPMRCAGVLFLAGFLSSALLTMFNQKSATVSIILLALLNGCMHGINLILICILPGYFKKYGNVALISGVLNSCTYLGSAISTYGIAVISDNFGWNTTLIVWSAAAVIGIVLCMVSIKPWAKKLKA